MIPALHIRTSMRSVFASICCVACWTEDRELWSQGIKNRVSRAVGVCWMRVDAAFELRPVKKILDGLWDDRARRVRKPMPAVPVLHVSCSRFQSIYVLMIRRKVAS